MKQNLKDAIIIVATLNDSIFKAHHAASITILCFQEVTETLLFLLYDSKSIILVYLYSKNFL